MGKAATPLALSKRHPSHLAFTINQDQIIHNPGQIPDPRYLAYCDLTIVFEETYSTYQIYGFQKNISSFQKSSKIGREAVASIIHGVPATLTGKELDSLVRDIRGLSGSIFITGLSVDYYASFWAGWLDFISGMSG